MTDIAGSGRLNFQRGAATWVASATLALSLVLTLAASPAAASLDRKPKGKRIESEKKDDHSPIPPGQLHIIINITTQRVAVYSDGVFAVRSMVSTGVPGHPTPMGAFSVIGKERYHASNIYSGAPMPFMQRITWSGVALHLGVVPGHPASHGCIRLTPDFAQLLWKTTKIGARVIIARTDVVPFEISHPRLFVAKPAMAQTPVAAATKIADAAVAATDAPKPDVPAQKASEEQKPGAELKGSIETRNTSEAPTAIADTADELLKSLEKGEAKKEMPQPNGPVSVFVSAKEKKIFVRQNFLPIFDAPVTIRDAGTKPLGTHVFTATGTAAELRWLAVSLPPDTPKAERKSAVEKISARERSEKKPAKVEDIPSAPSAAEALDRIDIPKDAVDRIQEMVTAGATLTLSDYGLGEETGEGTDFIVVTR